jgi:hypothetical protein
MAAFSRTFQNESRNRIADTNFSDYFQFIAHSQRFSLQGKESARGKGFNN